MAAAHPFGAFVRCRFKRIGRVRTIKVNMKRFVWPTWCNNCDLLINH